MFTRIFTLLLTWMAVPGVTLAIPYAPALETTLQLRVKPGDSFYSTLAAETVHPKTILDIIETARPTLRQIKPGTEVSVLRLGPQVLKVDIHLSARETLSISKTIEGWTAESESKPIELKLHAFTGVVQSSLWESAMNAGLPAVAIDNLAEVFSSLIDFDREIQPGDAWRMVIEEQFVDGERWAWGNILAAELIANGKTYPAYRFPKEELRHKYFATDGSSLVRMFLKSPIKYGRVTSRFNRGRFHPILKVKRPHLGVDLGAPTGTPVRAVGDGLIVQAGYNRSSGNVIKIRHSSKYTTAYRHLQRFAPSIKRGKRIQMGDIIGYVGSTGLATGPHLHYEFLINGRFTDPMGVKFPTMSPLPEKYKEDFDRYVASVSKLLPQWNDNHETQGSGPTLSLNADKSDKKPLNQQIKETSLEDTQL